jgi:hypothetical protein
MNPKFLVLALFYGDHPDLAQRCGETLRRLWNTGQVDLRFGLNEVSPRAQAILAQLLPGVPAERADPQIYKYPMMRKLLAGYRGDATHMMWFDDDSCLLPSVNAGAWLQAVAQRAADGAAVLGSIYRQPLTRRQRDWIRQQPWYTGVEVAETIDFVTGGWKVVPLDLMRRLDWPDPRLHHNGGDLMLGAMLQQQGLAPEQFRTGLAINADPALQECRAPRRGYYETAEALWSDLGEERDP